jgi:lysophospholipase L1-like esterase
MKFPCIPTLPVFLFLSALAARPVKIMPLGDSITKGGGCDSPVSYRKYLSDSLQAHGIDFDFVGSKNCQTDMGYDVDNEGLAGNTSWNILYANHDSAETETIYDWAPRYKPDIVLLLLGTNDVALNFTPDSTMKCLTEIVRVLREANPEVKIYLAQILPMLEKWGMKERAVILNDSIAALAPRLNAILVDQYTGIDPDHDIYDGTHPNNIGYGKMAVKWFAALYPEFFPTAISAQPKIHEAEASTGWLADGRRSEKIPATPLFLKNRLVR